MKRRSSQTKPPRFPGEKATSKEWDDYFLQDEIFTDRLLNAKKKRLDSITNEPSLFFAIDDGFGDDEVHAAICGLEGKMWQAILGMAERAEKEKLLKSAVAKKHVDGLVEFGWVWKHAGSLIGFRKQSVFAAFRPQGEGLCLPMVFVFKGHGWVPSSNLAAIARKRLRVVQPVDVGNVSGSRSQLVAAIIREMRAFADFLMKHGDSTMGTEARRQVGFCDQLINLLNDGGDPNLVSAALNVATQNASLQFRSDPDMIESSIERLAAKRSRRPDPGGIREVVRKAYLRASEAAEKAATKRQVLEVLTNQHGVTAAANGYKIEAEIISDSRLDRMLEELRKQNELVYPRLGKPGRPRGNGAKK
jgi:hypothetical protein